MRQRDDRRSVNRDIRYLLRDIRAGLVPPLVNRGASSLHQDRQPPIVAEAFSTTMSDTPPKADPPGIPSLIRGLERQVGRVESDVKLIQSTQNQYVGLPSEMAALTHTVGVHARMFENLSLSPSTGSTTFVQMNIVDEIQLAKRQLDSIMVQLTDGQVSHRDLANRVVALERLFQDMTTRLESLNGKTITFQANLMELLNGSRIASTDSESGTSLRPFLSPSQLTKFCGFRWIVTESTPAQLQALCRKLQEMSAPARMVSILRSGEAFHEAIGMTLDEFRQLNQQFGVAFCAIFHDKVTDATGKETFTHNTEYTARFAAFIDQNQLVNAINQLRRRDKSS